VTASVARGEEYLTIREREREREREFCISFHQCLCHSQFSLEEAVSTATIHTTNMVLLEREGEKETSQGEIQNIYRERKGCG